MPHTHCGHYTGESDELECCICDQIVTVERVIPAGWMDAEEVHKEEEKPKPRGKGFRIHPLTGKVTEW